MSLELAYSDSEEFWDFFHQEIWEKKPCVLKGAISNERSLSDADVMDGLVQVRKQFEDHQGFPTGMQCFINRQEVAKGRAGRQWLPGSESMDLETYVGGLSDRIEQKEFGFFVNDFQSHSPNAWIQTRAFFNHLFRRAGIPAGNIDLILFVSQYSQSPFGVHKDSADVFSLVVRGQKRMRVWPFQAMFHHARGRMVSPRESYNLDLFEYSKELEQSILLKGDAGDVLYWPSSYWHIAEGGADLAVSLHQFMNRGGNALGYFSNLLRPGGSVASYPKQPTFKHQPFFSDEEIPEVFFNAAQSLEKDLVMSVRKAATVAWLQRQSALGYGKILPPSDMRPLKESDGIQIEFPILIQKIEGEVLCAGGGYVHVLPKNPAVESVLNHINQGHVFTLNDLVLDQEKFASEGPLDLLIVKEFLENLLCHHAVRRVTEVSASKQSTSVPDFQTKNMVPLGVVTNADVGIF